jgi:hypothetical protein
MNQSHILGQVNQRVPTWVLKARKDIDPVPILPQCSGQFPHVDTHPTGIFLTKFPDWAGMDAKHRYREGMFFQV